VAEAQGTERPACCSFSVHICTPDMACLADCSLLQHSILLAYCLRGLLTLAAMSFAGCFSVPAVFAQIWQQECKRQGSEGQQTGPKAHA
jgi:hypothetical protein